MIGFRCEITNQKLQRFGSGFSYLQMHLKFYFEPIPQLSRSYEEDIKFWPISANWMRIAEENICSLCLEESIELSPVPSDVINLAGPDMTQCSLSYTGGW